MVRPARLTTSLLLATVAFLVFQVALFTVIAVAKQIPFELFLSFYPVTLAAHGVLLSLVLVRRNDFVIIDTGIQLKRVNLPNLLSMFRISSTPTILYLLILSPRAPLIVPIVVLVALAFISDFLDGRISRRLGEVTKIGTYLDSMSDYAILITVSIAFEFFHLIDLWFFVVVMARLGFQFLGMGALLAYQGRVRTGSNFLGKASIFVTMFVYGVATLGLIHALHPTVVTLIRVLEVACAVILVVSLVEKAVQLVRGFQTAVDLRKSERTAISGIANDAPRPEGPPPSAE